MTLNLDTIDDRGIGDNLPSVFEGRQIRTEDIVNTANRWLSDVENIESEEQAGRAADFKATITTAIRENEKARKGETAPLRQKVSEINDGYKGLEALLGKSLEVVRQKLAPWLSKLEEARKAKARAEQEEAERLRREAAEKAAAAVTIQDQVAADEAQEKADEMDRQAAATDRSKAQVHGEVAGRATSQRQTWAATDIHNLDEAFNYYRERDEVRELLLRLASADARHGRRRIPGFVISPKTSIS